MGAWLYHWLGLSGTGPVYGFLSGSGGVVLPWIMQAATLGLLAWWHHQCHVDGCYRYARRTTGAGERACEKHHPERKRTVEDIHAAHHAARQAESEGR